eukprot:Phypoly_transcript_04348.p1 GENE.Phypoly_transcript_04348~~Phypoly_transcript_04348.p1  ORF type:complete len:705 (-),score=51.28 Phypoly_transcript_04348:92-2161(-)
MKRTANSDHKTLSKKIKKNESTVRKGGLKSKLKFPKKARKTNSIKFKRIASAEKRSLHNDKVDLYSGSSGSDQEGEGEDPSLGPEAQHTTESVGSLAEVQHTNAETSNTVEPKDETKGHLEDEEGDIKPSDVFYERFVFKISEDAIRAQIKSHEGIVTKSVALSHSLLGTVLAVGAVAAGQEWACGLAREGIENSNWLTHDTAPTVALSDCGIRQKLLTSFTSLAGPMTSCQLALSTLLSSYTDVAYHCETTENHMDLMKCYVLHALNHAYRSRTVAYKNGLKLATDPSAEVSDQGFTRPKVLILCPLRNTAYDAIKFLCSLQGSEVLHYSNFKKRFSTGGKKSLDKTKPADYQHNFRGNVDDMFSLGITMKNDGTLSVNADNLYHADIIVASPVALRLLIGSPGDPKRNFDFLSSIEMVIVDQMDMMLMQNWAYLSIIFEHINLKPTIVRPGMDFSRMNEWSLSHLSAHRRQTIFFSEFPAPDINALFNRKCNNTYGKIKITNPPSEGIIEQVVPQIKQTFQRLECNSNISELDEQKFKLFSEEIFPHLSSTLNRVLLFIPSYFDYLRIRELFTAERESFSQADEYMKPHKVMSQCKTFSRKSMKWLLCTERCYYYNRMSIPRVKHIVFYAPPLFARFYTELLNPMVGSDTTSLMLYTKFEKMQLERIVGLSRSQKMLVSNKSTFLFC